MDFFLLNYSVLMISGATIGCGGKNISRMNESVNGGDVPLGNVEEVQDNWCKTETAWTGFKWCVLIKLTFKRCNDKKKSFSSRIS